MLFQTSVAIWHFKNQTFNLSCFRKPVDITYLCPFLLEELCVYLLADDLGADVILDSDAKSHLLQDELHLLLLLHGAIRLHLQQDTRCRFAACTCFSFASKLKATLRLPIM